MSMTGTIAADGSISGTWSQTGGSAGTFTASGATLLAQFNAKGHVLYTDANGDWYVVAVKAVSVLSPDACMAGPVVAASNSDWTAYWLLLKVTDNGEPGVGADQVWGWFYDEATALNGVAGKVDPAGTPATISSGNLQVH